ncbi:MAG: TrkH family potassium uptake protein, partial [bacterium]
TTMPTGGFSPAARSIEAFSATAQWIIIPFMFLAGTNFALLWRSFTGRPRTLFNDPEFRTYLGIIFVFSALLFVVLVFEQQMYFTEAGIRHSLFQTLSIITTTGYASVDFARWSSLSITILFLAMFIGGCAGSTGGGPKVIRWLVSVKSVFREMYNTIHPKVVKPVRFGKKVIDEDNIRQITMLILFYLFLFLMGTFLLEVDAVWFAAERNTLDVMSTVAACIGNIGPGFGIVGPMNNFLSYSIFSKSVLIFLMWIGRLEIFTVFVLFLPAYWKN